MSSWIIKDTTTFEMELCGHNQATAQAHVRPHGVCDWTLNTPKIGIVFFFKKKKIRNDKIRIRIC